MNAVRSCRLTSCLEIGTAYGVSAFFIIEAQKQCEMEPRLTTIEGYSPQKEISSKFLGRDTEMQRVFFTATNAIFCMKFQRRRLINSISFSMMAVIAVTTTWRTLRRLSPYFVMKQLSLLMTFDGMKKEPGINQARNRLEAAIKVGAKLFNIKRVKCAVEVDDSIGIIRLE